MQGPASVVISGAVEGLVDEAILRRLLLHVGAKPGNIYGKKGKGYLKKNINAFNHAAHFFSWAVLVDLNHDAECAPLLLKQWLPNPTPYMCFRIAVREIESWILADRERVAGFLSVPLSHIPINPEELDNPKQAMVLLAKSSRRREIREDMTPRPDSHRIVGPAYTSRLIEFVENDSAGWRPDAAALLSSSLYGCIQRLKRFVS